MTIAPQLQSEEAKLRHLLRRFGLGVAPGDLERYGKRGYEGALDLLVSETDEKGNWPFDHKTFRNRENNNLNVRNTQYDVYGRYLCTDRPLQAKMALFWHDHFATSAQKVDSGHAMGGHFETLRNLSLTHFNKLIEAVSKDPAMIYWLDSQENTKGKPNENFAREVMELFTLGVGNYTEQDVQEAARAFTGWTVGYKRGERTVTIRNIIPRTDSFFYFDRANHDTGVKALLGNKGPFDGEDVLGILTGQPRTAQYIATKALEWFCYQDPEPALVEKIASQYRANGLNSRALVKAIALAPEFLSPKAHRAVFKNPVDFAIVTMRQMGFGTYFLTNFDPEQDQSKSPKAMQLIGALLPATTNMGMELLYPPDVAGWTSGPGWISTATMVERAKWALRVASCTAARETFPTRFANCLEPQRLTDRLLQDLDAEITPEAREILVQACTRAAGQRLTERNLNNAAYAVLRLLFSSPEFQLM